MRFIRRFDHLCGMRRSAAGALCWVLVGCASSGPSDSAQNPAIILTAAQGAILVDRDDTASVIATVARTGGYTGDVAIIVDGAPPGVSASAGSSTGGVNTVAVRLTVAVSAVEGTYALTFRASGSGVAPDSSTVALTVAPPIPSSVSILLTTSVLPLTGTSQATATVRGELGSPLGGTVTWGSSNPFVASINSVGTISAVSTGVAIITANFEGITSSVLITVSPPPVAAISVLLSNTSLLVGATGLAIPFLTDAGGVPLLGETVTWVSSSPSVATIDAIGQIKAISPGSTTISATSGAVTGSALLTVALAGPSSVTVTLGSTTLAVSSLTFASAVVRDGAGVVQPAAPIAWSSTNQSVATITALGIVTAVSTGTTSIVATSGALTGSTPLTVTQAPVSTIAVALGSSTVAPGNGTTARATLYDVGGRVLTGRQVTWGSSDQSVATISSAGVIATFALGSVTITATSEGKTGSATLTVGQPAPPGATALCRDGTYSFSATRSGTCSHHGGVAIWL